MDKQLNGFFSIEELSNLLVNGEISYYQYAMHNEELKSLYVDFCRNNGCEEDETSAQHFFEEMAKDDIMLM